jgi:four helix bundle protein
LGKIKGKIKVKIKIKAKIKTKIKAEIEKIEQKNILKMYHSFEEMPVWQKSLELSSKVYELTISLPRSEDYGLTSQIRRSSNSISGNIAEAFGRMAPNDKKNFYVFARGSANETKSHLLYGITVGYFSGDNCQPILHGYDILILEINKIIKTLKDT